MKVNIIIERASDGSYSSFMDYDGFDFGLTSAGDSVEEVKCNLYEAYNSMKELYKDENRKFHDLEFNFIYDVASFLEYYSKVLTLAGLERITGVNQGLLSHYINGRKKPRKETVEKIEKSLHKFGDELSRVNIV